MTDGFGPAWIVGIDPFRTAGVFAVISGGLSLLVPWLNALTAALSALAVAGWLGSHRPLELGPGLGLRSALALLCGAAGAVTFVALPPPWSAGRGLALALSLVPLWWLDRRDPRPGPTTGAIP